MKIAITGHQNLKDPFWVRQEILKILRAQKTPLIGVTSLAVGADQIFAQCVLDCGGSIQVVVPMETYSQSFDAEGLREYERLLAQAASVEILPSQNSKEESYFVAGQRVVDLSGLVIAVWNGMPAAGLGGTADIVGYTRSQQKPYFHINTTIGSTILHQ